MCTNISYKLHAEKKWGRGFAPAWKLSKRRRGDEYKQRRNENVISWSLVLSILVSMLKCKKSWAEE